MSYVLQQLLIDSAKSHPAKDAVVFGNDKVTYGELEDKTNRLANFLVDNGVEPGDRVGIYLNKSAESIISIFSILKANAVYVPLDPQAPSARISYIIENCQIKCLLTSSEKANKLPEVLAVAPVVEMVVVTDSRNEISPDIDRKLVLWEQVLADGNAGSPTIKSISTDLAYILYTSGSTGNPKGVMISHLNALTFINWVVAYLKVNGEDIFSNHAPLHFDLSILDIFCCIKVGGTLCPVPETLSIFPSRLSKWIQDHRISVWYSVPSILSMMVMHGQLDQRDFSNMRMIIFAGEVFPVKYLRELMNLVPGKEYINLYGPTETNVITYYRTRAIPEGQSQPIPIGKCCENSDVFAVTKEGKIVTRPGEEGELMGRGTCVAQGYWGDPDRTSKVFVPNTFQPNFQEKIYKTGDLVTLNEDDDYIYVGRVDHMIKSRGYRIEIGEIEAALYTHPMISEAAVIAIPDDLISNRIKAVITLKEGQSLEAGDVRVFCAEKIPKYMVPEIIEFRQSLPKTSTGKIDKPTLVKESVQ
ncbi:amino acid adenylation domain-containing protein [Fulvivirgaceae bacterium BMA12]|uniref:Amino acid adenylation domain-containing protein n=1 Tax=Agaribacillus aureus TaxID=3051825 RepID=A0ABT8LB53_9BACT|nr:amino acid adenylation domain-containing protein [Fulvivirgaceae bacterium BMA12]